MSLGVKHYKPKHLLGVKHYRPEMSLGVKHYLGNEKHEDHHHHMTHSRDGIIYNSHNSADIHREPMKHHHDYEEKSYTKKIMNSSIEKPRKERRGEEYERSLDKKFS